MEEKLIGFETAKLAKEKGFEHNRLFYNKDGEIFHSIDADYMGMKITYENGKPIYPAPTQTLLQRWLREEHQIFVTVTEDFYNTPGWYFNIFHGNYPTHHRITNTELEIPPLDLYESALELGLFEALKLIKI